MRPTKLGGTLHEESVSLNPVQYDGIMWQTARCGKKSLKAEKVNSTVLPTFEQIQELCYT